MKNRQMLVRIVDKQEYDGEVLSAEMMTTGLLSGGLEGYTLVYDEQDAALQSCRTTLRVEGSRVTVTRSGDFCTEMVIEQDRRHSCHYMTPMGDFFIGVFARGVQARFSEQGGELTMHYTLDFNAGLISNNELTITLEQVRQR
jgi:uncharacterized beta-barrel protein YwiB (DUF1934 family)